MSAVGHSLLLLLRVPVIVCDQISVLAHKQERGVSGSLEGQIRMPGSLIVVV